jgi:hypothetical protein
LFAWKKRRHTSAAELMKDLLGAEFVPSHIRKQVKKAKILVNEKTLAEKEILEDYFGE